MKKTEKCYICGQEIAHDEEWEPYLVWEGDPHNDPDATYHEEKVHKKCIAPAIRFVTRTL